MKRAVVIAGAADITVDYKRSEKDSVQLAADAVEHALKNMGRSTDILKHADGLLAIPPIHFTMEYSVAVSQRLGMSSRVYYSSMNGGSSPIELLNLATRLISSGWHDFLLIVGGDSIGSHRRTQFDDFVSAIRLLLKSIYSKRELEHGLNFPSHSYAMYGIAHAAAHGYAITELQQSYAEMIADFSQVAAQYPPARMKEIVTPGEVLDSPPVALPFTKLMCANPQIDQGNALVVMSHGRARSLGIDEDRLVYVHGGGDFSDHKSSEDERDFTELRAARIAILQALAGAGIPVADVEKEVQYFDIYSCFPSVVNAVSDILGTGFRDFRRFTVTGGLPRRGGAGSLYCMSALAALYDCIVKKGGRGLAYGIGGLSTAHSAVVLGKEQREVSPEVTSDELKDAYRSHEKVPPVSIEPNPSGTARIVTYTVVYWNPARGENMEPYILCVGKSGGKQFMANLIGISPSELAEMEPGDVIGRSCRVKTDQKGLTTLYWE